MEQKWNFFFFSFASFLLFVSFLLQKSMVWWILLRLWLWADFSAFACSAAFATHNPVTAIAGVMGMVMVMVMGPLMGNRPFDCPTKAKKGDTGHKERKGEKERTRKVLKSESRDWSSTAFAFLPSAPSDRSNWRDNNRTEQNRTEKKKGGKKAPAC